MEKAPRSPASAGASCFAVDVIVQSPCPKGPNGEGESRLRCRTASSFDKAGKQILTWGKHGKGQGEFDQLHGIAMDSQGRIFVADRGNSRIQIFDSNGKFVAEWKQFGRPSDVAIDKNDVIYVADDQSNQTNNPGFKTGIRIGSAKDGKVTAFIPTPSAEIATPEGVGFWGRAHMNWLMLQKLEHREQRIVLEELLGAVRQESERVERLEQAIRGRSALTKATLNFNCNVRQLPNRLLANELASKPIHLMSDVA
jgi:NHL repeat